MVSCPQWTCISEAEWGRVAAEPAPSAPRPVPSAPEPRSPDILTRLADEMARDMARERDADAAAPRPPARQWPHRRPQALPPVLDATREPALVCYVVRGAHQCLRCQRWGLLHYSVIANACVVTGSTYRMGSQRHVLCPSCLSGLPHRMLF